MKSKPNVKISSKSAPTNIKTLVETPSAFDEKAQRLCVLRLKTSPDASNFTNEIIWPDGTSDGFDVVDIPQDMTSEGLFNPNWEIVGIDKITNSFKEYTGEFSGLPKVMDIGGRTEGFLQWIMNGIGDFFDYALGIILMGLKVQLIG